ncbi:MAG: M15 family metallopeptidase [Actinomycetota bacterium]
MSREPRALAVGLLSEMGAARLILVLASLAVLGAACSSGAASERRTPQASANTTPARVVPSAPVAPSGTPPSEPANPRGFDSSITPLRGELLRQVRHKNWHPGCPVPLSQLRVLTVDYHGFDGEVHSGPLVLNQRVVEDVRGVFERLYSAGFRIKHIALARKYKPNADRYDDKRDVTASFNCRPATGNPGSISQHSYGWAIDINPMQNPYIGTDGKVLRRAAKPYVDRSIRAPGVIRSDGVVVRAFARIGWGWGGNWSSIKDYMHFSLTGR